jgi:hypothetical protein
MGVGEPGVGVGGGGVGFAALTEVDAPNATITNTIKTNRDMNLLNTEDLLHLRIDLLSGIIIALSSIRVNKFFLVT